MREKGLSGKWVMGEDCFSEVFYYDHNDVESAIEELLDYLNNWSESNVHNRKIREIFGNKLLGKYRIEKEIKDD